MPADAIHGKRSMVEETALGGGCFPAPEGNREMLRDEAGFHFADPDNPGKCIRSMIWSRGAGA